MIQAVLTPPQANMLVYLRDVGRDGYDAARGAPTLVALERRGLARFGGTRAKPRVERWHIEPEGRDWLAARAAADAAMVL